MQLGFFSGADMKTEREQLKAFVVFLFILAVISLSTASFAAVNLSPTVPGYSSGKFSSAAGSFSVTAANDGFIKPSIVNVGGKAITVPATLRMAANAGQIVKNSMRLNPWGIAGTLAAGWLLSEGLQFLNGQWMASTTNDCWVHNNSPICRATGQEKCNDFNEPGGLTFFPTTTDQGQCKYANGYVFASIINTRQAPVGSVPATDDDWAALPDPLPAVAPELPFAPYMPEGAPVDAPNYEFAPMSVPLGEPYIKPDGSTSQPMAKVSPNGDSVTVDTYDQPLTDPQGNPVPNPTPQDTPEPDRDPCQDHPDRIGCMDAGTSDGFLLPKETHTMVFTPEASPISGVCPAPISMPGGHVLSFASACDAMTTIRPIVLALAGVMTAFMVIGVMRS